MEIVMDNSSIRDAAEAVLESKCRTVFVTDDNLVLHGSVTEGDLVRAFLRGINLEASVRHIMFTNPMFLSEGTTDEEARILMTKNGHSAIPIVDGSRKVVKILKQTEL